MKEVELHERRFMELSKHLYSDIIEPRLQILETYFDDALCISRARAWRNGRNRIESKMKHHPINPLKNNCSYTIDGFKPAGDISA